jgi:hypothetical protein
MILHKERNSPKLFGKFVKGGFKFDREKVPFYNVPDLTDFKV